MTIQNLGFLLLRSTGCNKMINIGYEKLKNPSVLSLAEGVDCFNPNIISHRYLFSW